MHKSEWIEQAEEDERLYGRSILNHDADEDDPIKGYYEFLLMHRDDDCPYGKDDWYEPMGHFGE
jgi:hypothetical protein